MKVLKDADDLFLAMNRKRQEYGRIVSNSSLSLKASRLP